jgi:heme/copper-type cytochrome/quinol oxidase subunit 2
MFATLEVVSQAEFDKWLAEQSAKARNVGRGVVENQPALPHCHH